MDAAIIFLNWIHAVPPETPSYVMLIQCCSAQYVIEIFWSRTTELGLLQICYQFVGLSVLLLVTDLLSGDIRQLNWFY